jgi:FkbM family methyltransferase
MNLPPGLSPEQYAELEPCTEIEHGAARMFFATPNTATRWRVDTINQKEPCTLEWIATLGRDEILFDVGANVGMYTIWAAVTRGARVYAFEAESQNYAVLNRNILLNNLTDRVKAYCLGLSDKQGLTELYMASMVAGGSIHNLGEALDYKQEPMPVGFRQGCVAFRLDDLVSNGGIPVPNHLKIDVDGIEPKIVAGAEKTLKERALKSLLIEVNPALADHRAMVTTLNEMGFLHDPAQVERAARKEGPFKGVAEYIFRRAT